MAGQIQHVGVSPGSRAGVGPNRPRRAAHRIRSAATYVNVAGLTVARIGLESKITVRLQERLDHCDAELRQGRPSEIHGLLRDAVGPTPTSPQG